MPDHDASAFTGGTGQPNELVSFNAAAWCPSERQYGILFLMMARQAMPADAKPPSEVVHLKYMDSRMCTAASSSPPPAPRRQTQPQHHVAPPAIVASDPESDDASEGEPAEQSDPAPTWVGRKGSWWRVYPGLGEDVVVRSGLSLKSCERIRIPPGDLVQQAGVARTLVYGRARGCIRVPVQPSGWVTADATAAGGPRYLVAASAPHWRVVYKSVNSRDGDAIVRADQALDSAEVSVLFYGDVVEQAGPSVTQPDGIVRMPVTAVVQQRQNDVDLHSPRGGANGSGSSSARVLGWVTVDASAKDGPVFFVEADTARPRRNKSRWP